MSDSEEEIIDEQVVYAADNISDYVQRTRYQQLFERKEAASKAFDRVTMVRREPAVDQSDVREIVRQAVESYVLEVESLYQQTEPGRALWEQAEIDVIPIAEALGEVAEHKKLSLKSAEAARGLRVMEVNGQQSLVVKGVKNYLKLPDTRLSATFEKEMNRRGSPTTEETYQLGATVPLRTSREVFRATNALLEQLDLGVSIESEVGDVESDYSELIDDILDENE
jgi:hypothetical protein